MPAAPVPVSLPQVLLVAAGGGLLAFGVMLSRPDVYRSRAILLPMSAAPGPRITVAAPGGESQDEDGYYTDILESRWMKESLLAEPFRFRYRTWKFGAERTSSGSLMDFLDPERKAGYDRSLNRLDAWIGARKNPKSGTIVVEVTTPSPELSYQLNRKMVQLLEQALKDKIVSLGQAKADYTRSRLELARRDEAAIRNKFVAFSRNHINYALSPDPDVRTVGESLYGELTLKRQVLSGLTLAYEQAEVDAHSTLPVVSVLDDGFVPSLKSGPARATIALAAALGTGLGLWTLAQILASLKRPDHGQAG
jgi:uncharacterized protein involved in exopolysaccharide biosynthesis